LKIFDTLSNTEKELDVSKKVGIYLCGITVYDESHIGHARTIIVFDVLRRFLESKKIQVSFVQNFTDVDDKIIARARNENISASEISSKYIKNYYEDFDSLNIKRATIYPKATEHIQDMQNLIQDLINKKIAYVSKNGIYFSVNKFEQYGKLSKKKIDELISGARVEVDEAKNEPLDFALWKFAQEEPCWDSPWGKGRPGWHIECSSMSIKYLGEDFEIHGGGRDLIFPHHENEIAQSESYTKKPFAKIWMHTGMVTINGEKMSKSLGNIKSVKNVLENWGPNVIRLFCLSGHYSKPIDYSEKLLMEDLLKWRQIEMAYFELALSEGESDATEIENFVFPYQEDFDTALNNDFNTSLALSAFYQMVKRVNELAASEKLTESIAKKILPKFEHILEILGLSMPDGLEEKKDIINQLIQKRNSLREQKQFEEADKVREEISKMNAVLFDHKNRTTWMIKENIKAET